MRCPACGYSDSKVVDSRPTEDGASIRRRRECQECGHRFTTYERPECKAIIVIKSDGSSEAFDRQKLMRGLLHACAKRPVSPSEIENLIAGIESTLNASQTGEIRSKDLGDLALKQLASIDDVAYIRFMSVYKDFKSVEEFASALTIMNEADNGQ